MMRFAVLGSGSSGNAAVVDYDGLRIMIDAGLSAKQLCMRLQTLGIDPMSLNGILLTHEHGDHVRGLKVFLKQHQIPVYATPATARVVKETGIEKANWKLFEAGQIFEIGALRIEPFAIQHDAVDPVGFVIGQGRQRLGFLSDAGFVTRSMTERLRGLAGLFCEANYDEGLLDADTKRPWSIKQRISSRHGHLSNQQVRELVQEIAHADLSRIMLGHLSSDCNTPEIILTQLRECLTGVGHRHVHLHCAGQDQPTEWFAIQSASDKVE
jgi:phosphoribosyl 1,2-cyclic phosphodiesterase